MDKIDKIAIQQLAEEFIKHWEITPPADLSRVLKILKTEVYDWNMPTQKIDGAHMALKDGTFIIIVNAKSPPVRKRFTIAHEIGHIYLRHYKHLSPSHREANIFATELLIPRSYVKKLILEEGRYDIKQLSNYFEVSRQAMEIRVKELGLFEYIRG